MDILRTFPAETCPCGRVHAATVSEVITGSGAVEALGRCLEKYGIKKPFILADRNTFAAAGESVCRNIEIPYIKYVFPEGDIEPDEGSVGSAVLHFERSCDAVIAIGAGVINDIGKILSHMAELPYFIVATAPSMDGYASSTSSMSRAGLKVSVPTKCADVIIGDTDILCRAPGKMLQAGLGDMLAKYISICEWRISNLITGEYYCERVADLVRKALKRCVENADGLLRREPEAVEAVFEGLVLGGIAMAYAGASRPASGVEHYFSHIWDMRGLEFGTKVDLHGRQCAVGTLLAARLYAWIKTVKPDREKALAHARSFDFTSAGKALRAFLGKGAEAMIAQEEKEKKYDPALHQMRLETILARWDEIQTIIEEEVPAPETLEVLFKKMGMPETPAELGIENGITAEVFSATRDIRDKYVLSRLVWDLGLTVEKEQFAL